MENENATNAYASDFRDYRTTTSGTTLFHLAIAWIGMSLVMLLITIGLFEFTMSSNMLISFGVTNILFFGLVNIETGFQYAVKRLGDRTGEVITEGYAWKIPFLYSGTSLDARDRPLDAVKKSFLSKDNVPVDADISCVYGFDNVAKKQRYQGDLDSHILNLIEEATRRYMLRHDAKGGVIFNPSQRLTIDELNTLRDSVAGFKLDIEVKGREGVRLAIDEAIKQYGAHCRRIIIENIRLPEDIEGAGGEELREALESAGDDYDWGNTVALAEKARDAAFAPEAWANLSPEKQGEFFQGFLDQVQAKKGQITRMSVSGGGPLSGAAAILKGG